jgi:intracellular sulfur oxidation DsrE/DsrF family protein
MENFYGMYSFHRGVQVVMADGSVRFLAETMEPETVFAMLTQAGGEVVTDAGEQ